MTLVDRYKAWPRWARIAAPVGIGIVGLSALAGDDEPSPEQEIQAFVDESPSSVAELTTTTTLVLETASSTTTTTTTTTTAPPTTTTTTTTTTPPTTTTAAPPPTTAAPPPPTTAAPAQQGCSANGAKYRTANNVCIDQYDKNGNGDINCGELPAAAKPVKVLTKGDDPYELDGDGDGTACES